MKYFKYILRNATRNKLRSALTALSVAISLAMMTVLYGFVKMEDQLLPALAKYHRLIVMNKQGFTDTLPIAMYSYTRSLPGVAAAVPLAWYMGQYKDEKLPPPLLATDPHEIFNVWVELKIDPDQLQVWQDTRNGCVVDRGTAHRRGWKIGEHIPMKGNNYEVDLDLTLCGTYDGPEFIQDMYFRWDYLEELLKQKNSLKCSRTSILFVRAESDDAINGLCEQIDRRYENSDSPTMSQSHQAFLQMFSKFAGNIQAYIRNIGLAVVFSLTLVAGNAMAMSMRERTTEIAVLKAIGFQRGLVLALTLGESIVVSLAGGVAGVAIGRGLMALGHRLWPQFIPISRIAWVVMASGVAVAAGIGLISGIMPAFRAARLSVIDGLRRVV